MSLLLSRYCTLLLPELQASEDSHGAFILRTWSSMSVLSIRFRYYMSAHEGPSSYSKTPFYKHQGLSVGTASAGQCPSCPQSSRESAALRISIRPVCWFQ